MYLYLSKVICVSYSLYKNWNGIVDIKEEFISWIIGINTNIIWILKIVSLYMRHIYIYMYIYIYMMWIELSAITDRTGSKWNSTPLRTFKSTTWVSILNLLKINQNILEYNYVAIFYPFKCKCIASLWSIEIG